MMALRTTAPAPITTSCMSTEASTMAWGWTRTPGEITDDRTVPPEMMLPAQTIESRAVPVPASTPWSTNLAGGSVGSDV